tara:strand:- start:117 stop:533 length:417 start_codon:yes stop_codon:yes gene_type:complete
MPIIDHKDLTIVSTVALVDRDSKVLIAQRLAGKSFENLWEFPGGKVKISETPESALIREVNEELGIGVEDSCLAPIGFSSYSSDDFNLLVLLYICRIWDGIPISMEGQIIKWVKVSQLRGFPMPPANASFLTVLRDLL